MTIYIVVPSRKYDSWNGYDWSEDYEVGFELGYFTSRADAESVVESLIQREVNLAYERHAQTEANKIERFREANVSVEVRQREFDALTAAGITPSFNRPKLHKLDTAPFREDKCRALLETQQRYSIEEIEQGVK